MHPVITFFIMSQNSRLHHCDMSCTRPCSCCWMKSLWECWNNYCLNRLLYYNSEFNVAILNAKSWFENLQRNTSYYFLSFILCFNYCYTFFLLIPYLNAIFSSFLFSFFFKSSLKQLMLSPDACFLGWWIHTHFAIGFGCRPRIFLVESDENHEMEGRMNGLFTMAT